MTTVRLLLGAVACLVLFGIYAAVYPQLTSRGIAPPAWPGVALFALAVGLPIAAIVKAIVSPPRRN